MGIPRRGLFLILMTVLALAWLAGRPPAALPPPPLGAPRPPAERPLVADWTLPRVNGESATLRDFRGRVLVLNFWATWCGPCRRELPALQSLHQELAHEGLEVVAVSVDAGDPESVARFARERGVTFPIVHDPGEDVARRYGTTAWPTTFVIDRKGRRVYRVAGAWDWAAPATRATLRELLSE
jgi:peroxiredoxin